MVGYCKSCGHVVETHLEKDCTGSKEYCVNGHLTSQTYNERPEAMPMIQVKNRNPYRLGKPLYCGARES